MPSHGLARPLARVVATVAVAAAGAVAATAMSDGALDAAPVRDTQPATLPAVLAAVPLAGPASPMSGSSPAFSPLSVASATARALTVTILPASGTVALRELDVTIEMCDTQYALDPNEFMVSFNSQDVTGLFTYTSGGGPYTCAGGFARATATLALQPGGNSMLASISNVNWGYGQKTASWHSTLPPAPTVDVRPDFLARGAAPGASMTQRIDILNPHASSRTYRLAATCSGAVSCSHPTEDRAIAGGATHVATVAYSVPGTTGSTGWINFTATDLANAADADTGRIEVTVGPATVSTFASQPARTRRERGLCLTLPAGPDGVYQCGELRLDHAIPGVRTLARNRAPSLIYASGLAEPVVLLSADVAPGAAADRIDVLLSVNGAQQPTVSYAAWPASETRRVTTSFLVDTFSTGLYPYTLEVRRINGGSHTVVHSETSELAVVNRAGSPYGAGWWVAGLEQLHLYAGGAKLLWVGGDGSARVYQVGADSVWRAPALTAPDSMTRGTGGGWVRHLPGGATVHFDATGRHVATRNRLGHETSFAYAASGLDRLESITVPRWPRPTFRFAYSTGSDTLLRSVTADSVEGPSRVVQVGTSGRRVTSFTDPDTSVVSFQYEPGTNRVSRRVNRRGHATDYAYGPGGTLRTSTVLLYGDGGAEDIVTRYEPAESRGLVASGTGTATTPQALFTILDGPRSDVDDTTRVWVDGHGAPRRIRNSLGVETVLERTNASYPALVTEVREHTGMRSEAAYDADGLLVTRRVIGGVSGISATDTALTRYEWDPVWRAVKKIVRPEGDSTLFAYHASTGNRLWEQPGGSNTRRVEYRYDATWGLLVAIDPPLAAPDSIRYDFTTLGNVATTVTGAGDSTRYFQDAFGRDTLVMTPIDAGGTYWHRLRTWYDLAGRVHATRSAGPAVPASCTGCVGPAPADALVIEHLYDREGNVLGVLREADPDRNGLGWIESRYTFDAAHRKRTEIQLMEPQEFRYDAASNVVWHDGRGGRLITSTFDALSRLERQVAPEVFYPRVSCATPLTGLRSQCLPTRSYDSLRVSGDTLRFTYDLAGRLRTANNRDARITRRHLPNGLLAADTLRLRHYAAFTFDKVFGLRYEYDRNGRRRALWHPNTVAPVQNGTTSYAYDPLGQLQRIVGIQADTFTWTYDDAGRPAWLTKPGGVVESYGYDAGSRQVRRVLTGPGYTLLYDTLTFDAQHRVRTFDGIGSTSAENSYAGLGPIFGSTFTTTSSSASETDQYRRDAHGNEHWSRSAHAMGEDTVRTTFDAVGRLATRTKYRIPSTSPSEIVKRDYDAAGNAAFGSEERNLGTDWAYVAHRSYYDGQHRLVRLEMHTAGPSGSPLDDRIQETRYDALGRRVLVRTRHEPNCTTDPCASHVGRVVWDGDQLLYELRTRGGSTESISTLESNYASGEDYGRVVYTHGPGLDAPLTVTRLNSHKGTVIMVPHANWRGQYEHATLLDGTRCPTTACLEIDWPAPIVRTFLEGAGRPRYDWAGSLIQDQRDATGLLYRRNRYYDPATGQFTQQDPIGLAGGLNLYGFAGGDPVNFTDPFGLCPPADDNPYDCPGMMGAFVMLGQAAPDINREVATFLPKNALSALAGLGAGALIGKAVGWIGSRFASRGATAAAEEVATVVSNLGSKAAARQALGGLGASEAQLAAARSAISRGTSNTSYELIVQPNGNLIVNLTRPGRDGVQVMQSVITRDGTKAVTQYGISQSGAIHIDPKTARLP